MRVLTCSPLGLLAMLSSRLSRSCSLMVRVGLIVRCRCRHRRPGRLLRGSRHMLQMHLRYRARRRVASVASVLGCIGWHDTRVELRRVRG